jgi:charged multivesicular body protein 6
VEFALVQKDVLYGLQQGTQVLQTINREMGGIENVERLMGDSEDARAYQEVWTSVHIISHLGMDCVRLLTLYRR